jgi:hypothetical protein
MNHRLFSPEVVSFHIDQHIWFPLHIDHHEKTFGTLGMVKQVVDIRNHPDCDSCLGLGTADMRRA